MHPGQALHQRGEQPEQFLKGQFSLLFQVFVQPDPVDEIHDNVDRVVLLEVVADPDDIPLSGEFCQDLRLLEEALFLFVKVDFLGTCSDRDVCISLSPVHKPSGKVFLDGDLLPDPEVQADVGDPEAALADGRTDHIPVLQPRPHRKLMRCVLRRKVLSAVDAETSLSLLILHAVLTIHSSPLFRKQSLS